MEMLIERVDNMDSKIMMYKPFLKPPPKPGQAEYIPPKSCVGCSNRTPVKGCFVIKEKFPAKRAGFYWIQSICSPLPMRVYCDFETKWV